MVQVPQILASHVWDEALILGTLGIGPVILLNLDLRYYEYSEPPSYHVVRISCTTRSFLHCRNYGGFAVIHGLRVVQDFFRQNSAAFSVSGIPS